MSVNTAKKRLLFVITQAEPWGGAQHYIYDLARATVEEFEVTVAIGDHGKNSDLGRDLAAIGIPVLELHHLVRRVSPIHDLLAVREMRALYSRLKPDVIHLNSSKAGSIGAFAAIGGTRLARMVYTAHGWVFNEPLHPLIKWAYRSLERLTVRWKDAVIVLSPEDKKVAIDVLRVPEHKLALIPLGITTPSQFLSKEEAREALLKQLPRVMPRTGLWIGTIANLFPTKGIDTLLDAYAIGHDTLPKQFTNIIIGKGPLEETLRNKISTRNLDHHVILSGFLPDASHYLPAFDLFVLPSEKEGLPYTILEAMAAGVPIVATRVGGVPSLLKKYVHATTVPPGDATALARAIEEQLKKTMTRSPGPFPEEHTLAHMVARTSVLYRHQKASMSQEPT